MLNGLRAWLISSFGAILLTFLIVAGVFISSINNSEKLEDYHSDLKTTRIFLLETHKLKEDIMMGDVNGDSYEKQFSELIKKYQKLNKKNASYLRRLQTSPIAHDYDLAAEMYKLKQLYAEYDNNYNILIYLYKLKGFKDFGLEGKMREYAHNIYEFDDRDIKLELLTLRKHEKDFLLRKDLNYVFLFGSGVRHLLSTVYSSKTISPSKKIDLTNNIYYYDKYFKLLAHRY